MNPNSKRLAKRGKSAIATFALIVLCALFVACDGRQNVETQINDTAGERPDIAEVLGTTSAFAQEPQAQTDTLAQADAESEIAELQPDDAESTEMTEEKTPVPAIIGGLVLSNIVCQLSDRDDFFINISVALFYNSVALREEIFFNRAALTVAVKDVMRRYEFGKISLSSLRENLLSSFNDILKTGQLPRIEIREFRVVPDAT